LEYQLRDSGASLILAGPEAAQKALDAARKVGLPESKVFGFCDVDVDEAQRPQPCGLKPWTSFWASTNQVQSWNWKKIVTKKEAEETTAVINYSSGTTGFPKGVEVSHYNLIANAEQASHKRNMVAGTAKGRARKERLDISGERWLAAIPMYHAYVRPSPLIPFILLTWSSGPDILLRQWTSFRSKSIYYEAIYIRSIHALHRYLPHNIHERRPHDHGHAVQRPISSQL
jgi:long-subunit acyl-CoA synthetase (AMP-forming)